ncbi:wax synthase family protein [Aspergillus chevalieri]|uniref:Wax synthase domain-containing protein n=1 Tax=Aspergillus chevalieri TaxID=182096 RepID=A0A7R7VRS2_ASPCH|nr:uncharacterized protein ACHE_50819A [Aspergillus chevalieri]BCR89621.1 hypothetical protein ACHE_50819A [Aspergillus chevalieri]
MFLPVFSFLTSVFFVSIALHHTTRLWSLPLILLPSYISLITANQLEDIADLWAIGLAVYFVHVTSLLYIEQWILLRPSPDKRYDFVAAYKLWSNPQLLKTARQVPGVHTVDRNHDLPQSRIRFTIVRVARITLHLLLMHLWTTYIFPGPFLPLTADDFSPTKEIYFRRLLSGTVTYRETAIRSLSAIDWIWTAYLTLDCSHDALGILFTVILRLDETTDWQTPLFGSPGKAYTLRGFWGRFWHRLVYRAYTNYGRCVGQRVLRLRPGSVAERWWCVFMVFGISGCSHAVVMRWVWGSGGWREVWFFVVNFVAGAMESLVLKWAKGRVSFGFRGCRILGFLWVFGFFFWSVPKREYPNIHALLSTI